MEPKGSPHVTVFSSDETLPTDTKKSLGKIRYNDRKNVFKESRGFDIKKAGGRASMCFTYKLAAYSHQLSIFCSICACGN